MEKTQIIIALAISLISTILSAKIKREKQKSKVIVKKDENTIVCKNHNFGFFSCCTVRLEEIIKYINKYEKLPQRVDSSTTFSLYKNDPLKDITFDFFENYNQVENVRFYDFKKRLSFHNNFQFENYKTIFDFPKLNPLLQKYFTPSEKVIERVNQLKTKYNIDTNNVIGMYFRGTDKKSETKIASFETFYQKLLEISNQNPSKKIVLQTDTAQFLDFIVKEKQFERNKIIIIEENQVSYSDAGIHNEKTPQQNYQEMFYLFATFLLISKSSHLICSSGNCSFFMMLYRGHSNNVYQFLENKWLS